MSQKYELIYAHVKKRPTREQQAQLDEILNGMLELAQSLPDYPTSKRQATNTSATNCSLLSSPGGKNQSISPTSDSMASEKPSEYTIIILNGSGSTKPPSEKSPSETGTTSPRYLTRPSYYGSSDDKSKPYHAQKGSQPFSYGVTASSPALQRRRIYSESTEYVKQGPTYSVTPPVQGETSKEIDEIFSDYASSTYQETFSEDATNLTDGTSSGLTWLQRQQLKLKSKREGRNLQERHWKEKRLLEELKTIAKRHEPSEDSRSSICSSPIYAKPLHVNTSATIPRQQQQPQQQIQQQLQQQQQQHQQQQQKAFIPARSSQNVEFKMYPAYPVVSFVNY